VFKDYVLFNKNVFINLITIFTLYFLIVHGAVESLIPFLTAFIMGSANMFAARKNKQYNLISEDPFFHENLMLEPDVRTIRFSKLKTVLSGSFIKIIFCFGLLMYHGFFEVVLYCSIFIIMIIGSLVEFIIVYRNKISSIIINKFLVYTTVIAFGISTYFETHYLLLYSYLMAVLIYCLIHIVAIMRSPAINQVHHRLLRNEK